MKAKPTDQPGRVVLEMSRRDEPLLAAASSAPIASPFLIKKILVPIDFSECSKKALRYAIPLAKLHQASLSLLFVVPTTYAVGEYGGVDYAALETEMRISGEKQLAALVADEVQYEIPSNTSIRTGSPAFEIIEAAKSIPADLIVISTHGRTGLKHVFLGSVTEHVVRRSPCPVLVVRELEYEFIARSN